jgi:hypothetical protein
MKSSTTHYPAREDVDLEALLILAHGAGAGQGHPFMKTMARGLAERGIDVVTFDFPYIQQKRRVPDKASVLEDCFNVVIAASRGDHGLGARRLFIGGKSMGGRMATHLAAEGVDGLEGLVLLGYPLHPPGKPEQLRAAHLPKIVAPMLIVQGERDAFGTPAELQPILKTISAPVTLHVVEGGDHSLGVPKSAGVTQQAIYGSVMDRIADWITTQCTVDADAPARPLPGRAG